MSSFSPFPNKNHIFLILLLFILSLLSHTSSSSYTNDLIQQECSNSDTPATCLSCVRSDPDAPGADRRGIAGIVATCIARQADTLAQNMTERAAHVREQGLKELYVECSKWYMQAKEIVEGNAKTWLENREFNKAEINIVKALENQYGCYATIVNLKGKVERNLWKEMNKYDQLSEAACRIIERLT